MIRSHRKLCRRLSIVTRPSVNQFHLICLQFKATWLSIVMLFLQSSFVYLFMHILANLKLRFHTCFVKNTSTTVTLEWNNNVLNIGDQSSLCKSGNADMCWPFLGSVIPLTWIANCELNSDHVNVMCNSWKDKIYHCPESPLIFAGLFYASFY